MMKILLIIFLLFLPFVSSSEDLEQIYPVRIVPTIEEKTKENKPIFATDDLPIKKPGKDDLVIGKLLDNSYILPEFDFRFDPVADILCQDYLMSSWDIDRIREYNYEKQEKLHQLQESEKIKKFSQIDFNTQSPLVSDQEYQEEDFNNRHLSKPVDPNLIKNKVFNFISEGNLKNLRFALDDKLDINHKDDQGRTLLSFAVISDKINLVRLLLARGANCHLKDSKNMKPIDYARHQEDRSIFNLLKNFSCE